MTILISILSAAILVLGYVAWNLLRKVEKLEDANEKQSEVLAQYLIYIDGFAKTIEYSAKRLQQIDEKGAYKSDDEIGWFFEQVVSLQSQLNKFKVTTLSLQEDEESKK